MGIVRFRIDHFAAITRYRDYVHGNITIYHVYYVKELGHILFFIGQFCNGDLGVAFCSKACYIRNLEGDGLLSGSRESNLYTISRSDMVASSPVCLMSKASSTKSCTDARLQLLHMDLCGPMRVESINGKRYISVILDDYFHYTWVYFLRSKDEAPKMITKFITRIQVSLRATIRFVRTDNGTKFKNETLTSFYEKLGIT
ncbi:putative ribonuclease H-like domain-containing protein [Tanacetum coccineum]